MKMITTKAGDEGQTTCGNKRVNKDDILVEAVGAIDELQAVLELIGANEKIIDDLSQIMGELGCGIKFPISNFQFPIEKMEEEIDSEKQKLTKFVKFKSKKSLELNWARTVCRRVERRVVTLNKQQKIDRNILKYFNRLSDYLFLGAIEQIKK